MTLQRRQQGVAMLTALLIVALAVIVVTSLFVQQRYSIRLSTNLQDLEQTYPYVHAAEKMAITWLGYDSADTQDGGHDSWHDSWSAESEPLEIDDDNGQPIGELRIKIDDLQAYFNVNNLYDVQNKKPRASMLKVFQQILQTQGGLPRSFAYSVVDWIDPDDELIDPESAESEYYSSQDKPYRASNSLIVDPVELRILKLGNITEPEEKKKLLDELMPLIIALPTPSSLNVNTASEEMLAAVGLTSQQVQAIVQERKNEPIKSKADLTKLVKKLTAEQNVLLNVSSNYYRLTGQVRLRKSRLFFNSILFRSADGKISVIMRQFNRVNPPSQSGPTGT